MVNNNRRYDIDWLRVFATFTIFLFHCARFFDESDWQVKNNQLDLGMSIFVGIVSQWIMPLFFVLSASSTYYALNYRTDREYLEERFKRLVIPLLFGIFVLIPPQVYIERLSHSQFSGSFLQFFPHYFDGFYGFGGNFAWMGLHLWYLEILFIFSLLTLPVFRYLRRVLPFYILHQTAIVIIGFLISSWEIGVMLKYLILSTSSFVAIVALYELIIKRFKVCRFLFGMKCLKAPKTF